MTTTFSNLGDASYSGITKEFTLTISKNTSNSSGAIFTVQSPSTNYLSSAWYFTPANSNVNFNYLQQIGDNTSNISINLNNSNIQMTLTGSNVLSSNLNSFLRYNSSNNVIMNVLNDTVYLKVNTSNVFKCTSAQLIPSVYNNTPLVKISSSNVPQSSNFLHKVKEPLIQNNVGIINHTIFNSNVNVLGTITILSNLGVGTSTPTYKLDVNGEITSRTQNAFRMRQSNYSTFWRNDNADTYFMVTNCNDVDGNWNGFRPFRLTHANGQVNIASTMTLNHAGNVGIGTSSPAHRLDVAGTINSTAIQGATISALSNLGLFGSNTSVSSSNAVISLSNYVYGTNTTNITAAQTTANFGSNTSVSASNVVISLSNYVYGTNTTNITAAQTTSSFGSNTAVWASNNINTSNIITINASNITASNIRANFGFYGNNAWIENPTRMYYNGISAMKATPCELINTYIGDETSTQLSLKVSNSNGINILPFSCTAHGAVEAGIDTIGMYMRLGLSNYAYDVASDIVIRNGGNVGIRTSNPAYRLDVNGTGCFTNTSGTILIAQSPNLTANQNANLTVGKALSTNNTANFRYTHRGDGSNGNYVGIGFWGNDDVLNVVANGNVGINTTSPSHKLDISSTSMRLQGGASATPTIFYLNSTGAGNTTGEVQFVNSDHIIACTDSNSYRGISTLTSTAHRLYYKSGSHNFAGGIQANDGVKVGSGGTLAKTIFYGSSNIGTSGTDVKTFSITLGLGGAGAVYSVFPSIQQSTSINDYFITKWNETATSGGNNTITFHIIRGNGTSWASSVTVHYQVIGY